ncbi:hypothetical protein CAPTEDRAFT_193099 [Capitella teleta]|uniref:Uncharacterized protein n=1 Tax=Capitella teleta TaxID=283909 RepID=R7UAR4_CAPTE|nr:hypothetical protein CAPTEDRAFT_193099 [Capitella teleta]|eukprot:ELU00898.1 hypothetical protein CAPTEDRAFT_193099 [Capitella teleta]
MELPEEPVVFILKSEKRSPKKKNQVFLGELERLKGRVKVYRSTCVNRWLSQLYSWPALCQQTQQHSMKTCIGDQQMFRKCSLMFDAKSILEHLDLDTNRMEMLGLVDYDK